MTNPVRLRLVPYNARLLDARKERGWTQKNMSLLTGLSSSYLGHIETLRVLPSRQAIDEISSALDLPADYLFPESLLEAVKEGVFGNRLAELEENQIIRLTDARRAGLLPSPVIDDKTLEAIEREVSGGSLKKSIADLLETLHPREKQVLELRFGLNGHKSLTLDEVGDEMGVSRERVRQIEWKALSKMRHPRRSRQLKDYLE